MHKVNIRNLDLNLLVALEALLEEASVTKAADRVALSQPAMSRALDRLRHVLKDPILVRSGRGMVLTPRAESLRLPLTEAMIKIRAVVAPVEFTPATSEANLRIMGADFVSHVVMPAVLERVCNLAPRMTISIENMSEQGYAALRNGELDLAIGVFDDSAENTALYRQSLFEDHFVCLMRAEHPLAKKRLSVKQFAHASHAMISITGKGTGEIDRRLNEIGLTRNIALRLPHFLAVSSVIAKTDLIVTLPKLVAIQVPQKGLKLVELPKEISGPGFTVSQAWHERFQHDPAHQWLRGIVKETAGQV